MTLGEDVDAALTELRAQAESRMTETVTVGLYADGTDPATGNPTRVLIEQRYPDPADTSPDAGKARIRWSSRNVTNADGPAMDVTVQEPVLSIPHGSPRLFDGDEVRVTASVADQMLVGRNLTVQGDAIAGQTTAHRYPLAELG